MWSSHMAISQPLISLWLAISQPKLQLSKAPLISFRGCDQSTHKPKAFFRASKAVCRNFNTLHCDDGTNHADVAVEIGNQDNPAWWLLCGVLWSLALPRINSSRRRYATCSADMWSSLLAAPWSYERLANQRIYSRISYGNISYTSYERS